MELREAVRRLAQEDVTFDCIVDLAGRCQIIARALPELHAIVAEAPNHETGAWLVECLRHGAKHAPTTIQAPGSHGRGLVMRDGVAVIPPQPEESTQ